MNLYYIQSREGARVVNPSTGAVMYFSSQKEGRAYARKITPEIPSSDLPLRVSRLKARPIRKGESLTGAPFDV